ncbi:hypothetical protein [Colwellia sp. E2M01]|uniref:hypothetical protein n=1 Tax=Colwellia sp. E2M01 TaxID=2841561 RepID=UPI001C097A23|nr:hypothetical protein [Colwellia sp. E2M01]MBU2870599.1 hypothetical protein [Colwellia sp. E2M01]
MFGLFEKKDNVPETIKIDKDGVIRLNLKSVETQRKFKEQVSKLKQFDDQLMAKG